MLLVLRDTTGTCTPKTVSEGRHHIDNHPPVSSSQVPHDKGSHTLVFSRPFHKFGLSYLDTYDVLIVTQQRCSSYFLLMPAVFMLLSHVSNALPKEVLDMVRRTKIDRSKNHSEENL